MPLRQVRKAQDRPFEDLVEPFDRLRASGGSVDVPDTELIALLEKRDGPLPERSWSHASEGECRYSELYEGQTCPWCEAARRREQREAAAANPD